MFNPKHLDNLVKNGFSKNLLTKFLSIEEQKYLKSKKHIKIVFSNTYPEEERKRALIIKDDYEDEIDFNISILEFSYNTRFYRISHKDALGSLMALGITRDVVGDIIIGERNFIIVCKELSSHIKSNLNFINRASIEISEVSFTELQNLDIVNYLDEQIIISSRRLDVIISHVAKVSRTKATEMINQSLVKVNGVIRLNGDYFVDFDDIISIRGIGRIIIKEELKVTKKNKIVLLIKKTL